MTKLALFLVYAVCMLKAIIVLVFEGQFATLSKKKLQMICTYLEATISSIILYLNHVTFFLKTT